MDITEAKERSETTSEVMEMSHSSDNRPNGKHDSIVKRKWYHVNAAMIPAKLAYFTDSGKRVGFAPFMVAFLVSIGLNKAEAGVIVGFRLIGSIVGGPFWGLIADKKQSHFIIFCTLIICSSFFLCSQVFLSIPLASKEINKCPAPDLESGNNSANTTQHDKQTSEGFAERKRLFFVLFAVNIAACFFEGSIVSFIDFAVLRKIQRSVHRKVEYGKQRLFSSLGSAVSVTISNVFIANFPSSNVSCYSAVFVMYVIWGLLCLFISSFLFRDVKLTTSVRQEREEERSVSRKKENLRKELKETCLKLDTILFFASAFISGTLYAVYRSFIYVYLQELNASNILLTMVLVVAYVFSVPMFFFEGTITKFIRGTWQGIALSFATFCVRFLTISFAKDPWLAMLAEATHAFTFPYFVAVGFRRIREISPACILTTMCSIFNVLTYAIGYIAGSSIGGVVYEEFGGRTMYRIFGILSGVFFVGISVYVCITKRREKCSVADIASS